MAERNEAFLQSRRVLVVSHEVVGAHMAGPGIRYMQLANVIAREFEVTLAAPLGSAASAAKSCELLIYVTDDDEQLQRVARESRVVVVPAVWLARMQWLADLAVPLVIDGYDPVISEMLAMGAETRQMNEQLQAAYRTGDFFMCASERQRDWWLGLLEASGRINAQTYAEDVSLRRLIDVVPFGLPDAPPHHTRDVIKGVWRGIAPTDRVLLWGGGLWQWLDPLTAIRAVARANVTTDRGDLRLIFPGTKHPNPAMAQAPTHTESARALARELGVLDRVVFFGDWIAYDDWQNVLCESDLALTLHHDTLETRLAFRSRVLDYVWAGLPIIATRGDATSEIVERFQLGEVVNATDVEGVCSAILRLLDAPRARWHERFAAARAQLTWERVAQPLIAFCRQPRLAPDIRTMVSAPQAAYDSAVEALQRERDQLRSERNASHMLVQQYERGRFMRIMRRLQRLRRALMHA